MSNQLWLPVQDGQVCEWRSARLTQQVPSGLRRAQLFPLLSLTPLMNLFCSVPINEKGWQHQEARAQQMSLPSSPTLSTAVLLSGLASPVIPGW